MMENTSDYEKMLKHISEVRTSEDETSYLSSSFSVVLSMVESSILSSPSLSALSPSSSSSSSEEDEDEDAEEEEPSEDEERLSSSLSALRASSKK